MNGSEGMWRVFSSVSWSLWGYVTPNLRAVYVFFDKDNSFEMNLYYDQSPNDDEEELGWLAETEVIADFPFTLSYRQESCVKVLPYPQEFPRDGFCVYHRYEKDLEIEPKSKLDIKVMNLTADRELRDAEVGLLVQKGLIDKVTPNMRQVRISLEDGMISLCFYCDSSPSDLERRLFDGVFDELIEDLPRFYQINKEVITLSYPNKIADFGRLVYLRYEPSLQ